MGGEVERDKKLAEVGDVPDGNVGEAFPEGGRRHRSVEIGAQESGDAGGDGKGKEGKFFAEEKPAGFAGLRSF